MSLKDFIVTESVRTHHAERYLTYVERYHHQVMLDARKHLTAAWEQQLPRLSREHPPDPEAVQDASFISAKMPTELELVSSAQKLTTSRANRVIEVAPSVRVPFVYSTDERALLLKQLLATAEVALEKTLSGWKEVFHYEHRGQLTPWFKVVRDSDELRLQLAVSQGDTEAYRTLMAVRVEYGKKSKLRAFDRIYLTNLIPT